MQERLNNSVKQFRFTTCVYDLVSPKNLGTVPVSSHKHRFSLIMSQEEKTQAFMGSCRVRTEKFRANGAKRDFEFPTVLNEGGLGCPDSMDINNSINLIVLFVLV